METFVIITLGLSAIGMIIVFFCETIEDYKFGKELHKRQLEKEKRNE